MMKITRTKTESKLKSLNHIAIGGFFVMLKDDRLYKRLWHSYEVLDSTRRLIKCYAYPDNKTMAFYTDIMVFPVTVTEIKYEVD